jgi:glutathione S-transferase
MIKLFWCPQTRSSRAMWMLEEMAVEYQRVHIDIRAQGGRDDADFQAASPMNKVPALKDGDTCISDSSTICLYLADRYPDRGLAPNIEHPDRGRYLYWMTFTPGVIEPCMAEKAGDWPTNPTRNGWGNFDMMVKTLAGGLSEGPWLLGERFSAADVMVGSSVCFMQQFGLLSGNDILDDYAGRCLARPAYQRALAADQESA